VGDFCGKGFVMHEKEVHFPSIENKNLLQAIGKEVSGL
jgi:hypothetical protein